MIRRGVIDFIDDYLLLTYYCTAGKEKLSRINLRGSLTGRVKPRIRSLMKINEEQKKCTSVK